MKKDECHEFQGNFSSGVIDMGDQKRLLFRGVLHLFLGGILEGLPIRPSVEVWQLSSRHELTEGPQHTPRKDG